MFGYVRVYTPELKVRENEFYRAAYCGLCRASGRCTGCLSRFALSYDFVFLALVRIALTGEKPVFELKRCAAHPTKKRSSMISNPQLEYCARAAAILTCRKIEDDIADEKGTRKLAARAALLFFKGMRRRALDALPELDGKIALLLDELYKLEKSNTASVDKPAEIFGRITEEITAYGLVGDAQRIARKIGRHTGKWIYIADALDDYREDIKLNRFNPLRNVFGDRAEISAEECQKIREALLCELSAAECAFDLLEYEGCHGDTLKGIISNIIYFGMPRRIDDILQKCMDPKDVHTGEDRVADERSV